MSKTMIEALDTEFREFPILVAGPAGPSQIEQIEQFAGFNLPLTYKEFLARYGGAIVGSYSVYGWGASSAMGSRDSTVIEVTNRFRADHWPGSDRGIVISMDQAGNAIILDESGKISRFDHDSGATETLAPDFERFILSWCLRSS